MSGPLLTCAHSVCQAGVSVLPCSRWQGRELWRLPQLALKRQPWLQQQRPLWGQQRTCHILGYLQWAVTPCNSFCQCSLHVWRQDIFLCCPEIYGDFSLSHASSSVQDPRHPQQLFSALCHLTTSFLMMATTDALLQPANLLTNSDIQRNSHWVPNYESQYVQLRLTLDTHWSIQGILNQSLTRFTKVAVMIKKTRQHLWSTWHRTCVQTKHSTNGSCVIAVLHKPSMTHILHSHCSLYIPASNKKAKANK